MKGTTAALSLSGLVVAAAACTHAIDGAPCGCAEGYTCCVATNRCERGEAHCPQDLVCSGAFAPACQPPSQCVDQGGIGTCVCEPGYQGTDCAECASGWVQKDGLCVESCAGAGCMTCQAGDQGEGGACVSPCEALGAPDCGAHGSCEVMAGQPSCVCTDGYRGPECAECPEGQLPGDDGSCTPACAECGEHQVCAVEAASAHCACVAGYADASTSDALLECSWQGEGVTGGVRDTGFEDANAWESQGAVFDADAFGQGDQGVYFAQDQLCAGKPPYLSQVIQMPPRELSEPFVLVIEGISRATIRGQCPISQTVLLGATEHFIPFLNDTVQSVRLCMGDEAYGPDVHLSLVPEPRNCPNETCKTRMFSGLRIEPAQPDECPGRELINPNFDAAGGWTLTPPDSSAATITDGQLQLHEDTSVFEVSASQLVHVPTHANGALQVTYLNHVSFGGGVMVSLGGIKLFELQQGGLAWLTREHCIPHELLGSFRDLRVSFETTEGGVKTVAVDSVRFFESAACAVEETGVQDPSLEQIDRAHWWFSTHELGATADTVEGGHEGERSFVFTGKADDIEGRAILGQLVRVPRTGSSPGLRLEFYQRGDAAAANTSEVLLSMEDALNLGSAAWGRATVTSEWTKVQSECLPRWTQGRLQHLQIIAVDAATGDTGQNSIYVDDVKLVPDGNCP